MNEVLKNIKERRSVRSFKQDKVKEQDIKAVVEAGLYAPSGMGRQDTIILAIINKALRDQLSKDNAAIMGAKEGMDPFYGAPVILVVLAKKATPTGIYDGSLVMENMMLAATSLGLGSIWIHRAKEEFDMDKYKKLLKELSIQEEYVGIGHCAIGYVEGTISAPAPRKDNRVFYLN